MVLESLPDRAFKIFGQAPPLPASYLFYFDINIFEVYPVTAVETFQRFSDIGGPSTARLTKGAVGIRSIRNNSASSWFR